jgi:hypothetical protein
MRRLATLPSTRFVDDSPLEGAGFEPSVPLAVDAVGARPLRKGQPCHTYRPPALARYNLSREIRWNLACDDRTSRPLLTTTACR